MAKKMVDEIREAESEAEKVVNQARIDAEKIVADAENSAADIIKSAEANAKKQAAAMVATADNNAFKTKSRASEENSAKAAEYAESARANFSKTVDFIVNQIIPE